MMLDYHDNEWGRPIKDDLKLFQKLMLDCQQAGLSWAIILNKRENFLKAFDNFNPTIVSKYDNAKVEELMNNPGIVRNRLKIKAMIINSKMYLEHFSTPGSFTNFLWQHVNHKPINSNLLPGSRIPATSSISDEISLKLKKLGFKFVGSTIIYAFLQAVGIYNDHYRDCFCHPEILKTE